MLCSKDNKDFKAVVKKSYKLGKMNGENRLQRTINRVIKNNNTLLRANQRLTEELLRLDQFSPLQDTPSIIIPLKRAKSLLRYLNKNPPLRTYITNLISEQLQNYPDLVDKSDI